MRKKLSLLFSALLPALALAEEVPSMVISQSDGSMQSFGIATIRSIKFEDGNMIVCRTDAGDLSLSVDDITMITFGNMETAIASIVGKDNHAEMLIADLSGRTIYRGTASAWNGCRELHGTFIISAEGKNHKVTIK